MKCELLYARFLPLVHPIILVLYKFVLKPLSTNNVTHQNDPCKVRVVSRRPLLLVMLCAPVTVRHKPNTVCTTDHLHPRPEAVPPSHTFNSAAPQDNRRFRRHLANVLFRLVFPRPTKSCRIADYDNEEVENREWLRIS